MTKESSLFFQAGAAGTPAKASIFFCVHQRCFAPAPSSSNRCISSTILCAKERKSVPPPQSKSPSAIRGIVNVLRRDDTNVTSALRYYSPSMELGDWFTLLEELGSRKLWLVTLEAFRWIQQQKWYRPDDGFFAKLISILGKNGQLSLAIWLFREMRNNGFRPDTTVYNALIGAVLRGSDKEVGLTKAFCYFERMKTKVRCKPDLVTYNSLLRACAQLNEKEKMQTLFKEMDHVGLTSDTYTFNGILDAYGKAGLFFEMELTLRQMRRLKVKPDLITFNILIDAYGKGGVIAKMEEVLQSMVKFQVKPELSTFHSLLHSYGGTGHIEEMEVVFENVYDLRFRPTLVTYELMIKGYGQSGCIDEMKRTFHMMCQAGIKPEISTLHVLMDGYCYNGRVGDAEELLESANQLDMVPTSLSYLILYKGYWKERCFDKLDGLIEKMASSGIRPNEKFFLQSVEMFILGP